MSPPDPVGVPEGYPVKEKVADEILGSAVAKGGLLAIDVDRARSSRGEGEGIVGAIEKGSLIKRSEELLAVGRESGFPFFGRNGLEMGEKFKQ